jgi:hypothetical protein
LENSPLDTKGKIRKKREWKENKKEERVRNR